MPRPSSPSRAGFGRGGGSGIAPQAPSYTPVENKTWEKSEDDVPEDEVKPPWRFSLLIFFFIHKHVFLYIKHAVDRKRAKEILNCCARVSAMTRSARWS
jgi:hypothetical protein